LKHLGLLVGLVITLLGAAVGYGQLQNKQENTSENVEEVRADIKEVEADVEENEDNIGELQDFSIRQQVLNEMQFQLMEKMDDKIKASQ